MCTGIYAKCQGKQKVPQIQTNVRQYSMKGETQRGVTCFNSIVKLTLTTISLP